MTALTVIIEGDGAFPDMKPQQLGVATAISRLAGGMTSGKSSVCIELTLPDGTKAYGETSLATLHMAARVFVQRDVAEGRPSSASGL